MNKTVGVIVVTYNRLNLLKECLNAIRTQSFNDLDIIVVNNGSTDGTLEWLNTQPDITVISQPNTGGAGGFFSGIKYCVESNYKFSWVMDDDTIPFQDALEKLINASKSHSNFGFMCSKVLDINNQTCNYPSLSLKKAENGEYMWLQESDSGLIQVRCSTFVSVLINNSLTFSVGLPYKEFFIWGDDIEYTMRFSDNNNCYLVLNSKVLHKRKSSQILSIFTETDKRRIKNYFYSYRNQIFSSAKRSKIKAFGWYILALKDSVKLLFQGEVSKAFIIQKALIKVVTFSPKLEFPKK